MSKYINISRKGAVQIIRIMRADKKNALTRDMYRAMSDALDSGDADDEVRCHLFLGHENIFTSGNDISDFMQAAKGGTGIGDDVLDFLRTIIRIEKPMLAGVDGLAIGIGTTMLMHCDLVYASPNARLKTPFLDLGLLPEAASTLVAPRILGYQQAFLLLAMGEELSADQAKNAGLVTQVTGEEDLEENVLAAAEQVAARPPQAMALTRRLLRGNRDEIVSRMEEEAGYFAERLQSKEAQQAFMAFLNRSK